MSAINVLVQSDAVHLLTDGAAYEQSGKIVSIGPKALAMPHLCAAVAARGPKMSLPFIADTLSHNATSFDDLRDRIVELLQVTTKTMDWLFQACEAGSDIEVVIAGWSESRGPDAYAVFSHDRYGIQPWTVIQMAGLSMMPNDPKIQKRFFESIAANTSADNLDPSIDGLRMLEIQRDNPVAVGEAVFSCVGGFAQLTTIARDGISSRILQRWPEDQVSKH